MTEFRNVHGLARNLHRNRLLLRIIGSRCLLSHRGLFLVQGYSIGARTRLRPIFSLVFQEKTRLNYARFSARPEVQSDVLLGAQRPST